MSLSVSIALCTYTGEKYLQQQLDSYTRQTILRQELVACDDNSSDSTIKILQRFSESAPFSVPILRNAANYEYALSFSRNIPIENMDLNIRRQRESERIDFMGYCQFRQENQRHLLTALVRAISQDNQGQSTARNRSLDLVSGEYIARVDSDDTIDLDYYLLMRNKAETENADYVSCFCSLKGPLIIWWRSLIHSRRKQPPTLTEKTRCALYRTAFGHN